MSEHFLLYDETEHTTTRFVGYSGEHSRFDLAITTTAHFYGKKLVMSIQSGISAILSPDDATNVPYLMETFRIRDEEEATEFSDFLSINL